MSKIVAAREFFTETKVKSVLGRYVIVLIQGVEMKSLFPNKGKTYCGISYVQLYASRFRRIEPVCKWV